MAESTSPGKLIQLLHFIMVSNMHDNIFSLKRMSNTLYENISNDYFKNKLKI